MKTERDQELGKRMAKAAAFGAVIALPVPFVGPIAGAIAGAGYAWYKDKRRRAERPDLDETFR